MAPPAGRHHAIVSLVRMTSPHSRTPLIDMIKGVACATIVWHHLAFYGPMSDIAQPLAPDLMAWLYDYGRMAVQVFLVLGGYLAAASLAPQGLARLNAYARLMQGTPLVAIGGIDTPRLADVLVSGVGSVAVVRALIGADNPEAEAGRWIAQIQQHLQPLQEQGKP